MIELPEEHHEWTEREVAFYKAGAALARIKVVAEVVEALRTSSYSDERPHGGGWRGAANFITTRFGQGGTP